MKRLQRLFHRHRWEYRKNRYVPVGDSTMIIQVYTCKKRDCKKIGIKYKSRFMHNEERENIKNWMAHVGEQCVTQDIYPVLFIGITDASGTKELKMWTGANYPTHHIKEILTQIIEQL